MTLADIELIRELIVYQAPLRAMPLADRRRQYEWAEKAFGERVTPGEVIDAGGCAAEWVAPQRRRSQPVVVYLHGGGYSLGSSRSHRHLAASIGSAADAAVLSLDYRRAPEFAFPAAVDDVIAATRWLLEWTSAPVVLAGDSAGGGLVVASMVALRDAGSRIPSAGVCLSPWVDLTCTADAHSRLADRDPLLSASELKRMAESYLRDVDPRHPLASPAFATLAGLPPLLIQAGTEEILLDDARTLANTAREEGVDVTLEEWPEMVHTWHWYFPVLDDGRRAIESIGRFIRGHATDVTLAAEARHDDRARIAPASLIQEAHLLIAASTAGRGYLSWVYQLNGRLDAQALVEAVDDVISRHEILRTRFEHRNGGICQVVTPFVPGALRIVDLGDLTKRDALSAAVEDVERVYRSLSPSDDPRFRATLYTIDPKTSVLAMFVAEALVDSDSGSLLAAEITRAYAEHRKTVVPTELPRVSDASYLGYVISHPADPEMVARAREHWVRQGMSAPPAFAWPMGSCDSGAGGSSCSFEMAAEVWTQLTTHAQALHTTPYVLILTCLQSTLARTLNLRRFLAHSIVSERDDATEGMIGNFHSLVRIDMRLGLDVGFGSALSSTAAAVAQAIEHSALPAPLTASATHANLPQEDLLQPIRFYMFASHGGPSFAGVRRRRFRLHALPCAPLSVSCIYGPNGRQDFVFSSTTARLDCLEHLARTMKTVIDSVLDGTVNDRAMPISNAAGAPISGRPSTVS